jgi:hypothetical protein
VEAVPVIISGNPNPNRILNIACRMSKPDHANADAPPHAINERLQQEIREPQSGHRASLRLLQLLPDPQNASLTPAMEAKITDRVWSIAALVATS